MNLSSPQVRAFAMLCAALLLVSCSAPSTGYPEGRFVRRVDYRPAPVSQELAARAEQLGNQLYPNVCSLLYDGKTPCRTRFNISFEHELPHRNSGETCRNQIRLNASYVEEWKNDPGVFDSVVVHEMAHVAQHYEKSIIGRWLTFHHNAPSWLVEGIADYVTFNLGETNGWHCAECSSRFPDYRDGYSCAGALLSYLAKTYNAEIVKELNRKLRWGGYSDRVFVRLTGKDLQTLWSEFQHTEAFTTNAARMLALRESLNFVNNKAPKDVDQRLENLVNSCSNQSVRSLMSEASVPGGRDWDGRLTLFFYFSQPGGTAEGFITGLKTDNQLPGFAEGEKGMLTGALSARDLNANYPVVCSFTAKKRGDDSTYHYLVTRRSADACWSLDRAWRTGPDGDLGEEYCVQ
jgi:hypothetical protein